ncbi:MAG: hypothetical protein WCK08_10780 [Betaproteobacteria bacterium]
MDLFITALLLALVLWSVKSRAERRRVALLALHLQPYDIEKLMQQLSEGYVRALGEGDAQRRLSIWQVLEPAERKLADQMGRLAQDFGQLPAAQARIIALPLPWLFEKVAELAPSLLARHSLDMRELLKLQARAMAQAVQASGGSPSARAYGVLAQVLLMQHSCHWFCKSRAVASARLLARHQSSHLKVLESVDPATRAAYEGLIGGA